MVEVIGFSGKMASGKDYTANWLAEYIKEQREGAKILFLTYAAELRDELNNIATLIKTETSIDEMALQLGVTEDEIIEVIKIFMSDENFNDQEYSLYSRTSKARELLQYWGTDVRRKQNNDYWVRKSKETVLKLSNRYDFIIFTDARFPNECEGVRDLGGVVIRCKAPDEVRKERLKERGIEMSSEALSHCSETALDNYEDFDIVLDTSLPEVFSTLIARLSDEISL